MILIHAITILAIAGSTLGEGKAVCNVVPGDNEDMFSAISRMALACLEENGGDVSLFTNATSPGDREAGLKTLCDKRGPIGECLAAMDQTSEACLDQTLHQSNQINRELIETALDAGCTQDGAVVASMVTTYLTPLISPLESEPLRECISVASKGFDVNIGVAISSWSYLTYREALTIHKCFEDIADGDHKALAVNITSILGEIINKMKCTDPRDGSTVLCNTIDATLCLIGSADEKEQPLGELIVERITHCVEMYVLPKDPADSVYEYLPQRCSRGPMLERCWAVALSLSSACLNETEHAAVSMLGELLRGALRYGCLDEGEILAHVLSAGLQETTPTSDGPQNHIQECVNVAIEPYKEVGNTMDAAKILFYYRQLDVFKGCLVGKLRGDNLAVHYANTVLTLLQRDMKCLDPNGNVVPCDTVDTTTPAVATECLFVGEDPEEPPAHDLFVDLGMNCLKLIVVDNDSVESLTTIEESRTFFRAACRRRTDVLRCLEGLTTLSEPCQNGTDRQMLQIFADFVSDATRIGCERDGEVFADLLHAYVSEEERVEETGRLKACLNDASARVKNASRPTGADSPQAKSVLVYRAFESMNECFGASDIGSIKAAFTSFINEILRSLKCIHSEEGTLVLCETIINN